jgi:hypothetical protein
MRKGISLACTALATHPVKLKYFLMDSFHPKILTFLGDSLLK